MDEKIFESGELEFAYDDVTADAAAARIAKRFGVLIRFTRDARASSMGWPTATVIGELNDVARTIRECWVSGDDAEDAEILAHALAEGSYIVAED